MLVTTKVEVLTPKEIFTFYVSAKRQANIKNGADLIPAWEYVGLAKSDVNMRNECYLIVVPKTFAANETPAPNVVLPDVVATKVALVICLDGSSELQM